MIQSYYMDTSSCVCVCVCVRVTSCVLSSLRSGRTRSRIGDDIASRRVCLDFDVCGTIVVCELLDARGLYRLDAGWYPVCVWALCLDM
jgi:hypothetical protein